MDFGLRSWDLSAVRMTDSGKSWDSRITTDLKRPLRKGAGMEAGVPDQFYLGRINTFPFGNNFEEEVWPCGTPCRSYESDDFPLRLHALGPF